MKTIEITDTVFNELETGKYATPDSMLREQMGMHERWRELLNMLNPDERDLVARELRRIYIQR